VSNDAVLLVYATRYALGRMTFAPREIKDALVRHQGWLNVQTVDVLIRDIEEHGKRFGNYGMRCDDEQWADTLDWLREMRPIIERQGVAA
jgi:hypothetical protein